MRQKIKSVAILGVKWSFVSSLFTAGGYLAMFLILVRILPQSAFGTFAIANIAAGLGNLGADLGFSQAIVQKRHISSNQLSSLYFVNLMLSCVLFCFAFPLGIVLENFYKTEDLCAVIVFTMLTLIINAFGLQFYSLLQKNLLFKQLAISEIIGQFCLIIVTLWLAFSAFEVWALVFGLLSGKAAQTLCYIYFGQKIHRPRLYFNHRDIEPFWNFGLFQTGRSLLYHLSSKVDTLLIGKFTGVSVLGIYEVFKDLLIRPIALINPVIARVAFPILAQQQNNASVFSAVFKKTMQIFNSLTAVSFAGCFYYADFLTVYVLGEKWVNYDSYLRLLSVALFLHYSVSPMGDLITASGKPQIGLYWNIFNLFITVLCLSAGSFYGLQGVLIALIGLNFAKLILSWYFIIRPLSGLFLTDVMIAIFQPLFTATSAGFVSLWLFSFSSPSLLVTCCSIIIYLLSYLIFSVKLNSVFFQEIKGLIKSIKV